MHGLGCLAKPYRINQSKNTFELAFIDCILFGEDSEEKLNCFFYSARSHMKGMCLLILLENFLISDE